ncbi:MAG TPA: hypothetical protein VGX78_18510, partial [Pirellulales bacterium]|nr:hypothetical protein [Pirellulales bacterium]
PQVGPEIRAHGISEIDEAVAQPKRGILNGDWSITSLGEPGAKKLGYAPRGVAAFVFVDRHGGH